MSRVIRFSFIALSLFVRLFPYAILMRLGDVMGDFFFFIIPFRKAVVIGNLNIAFSDTLSPEAIHNLARKNYRHYGRMLFDFLLSVSWGKKDYLRNTRVVGLEHGETAIAHGKGVFFLVCHLGSWELGLGVARAKGIPFDVVVKRARNRLAEEFLQWYRRKTGAGVLLESGTHYEILRRFAEGLGVVFVFDQFMGPPIGLPVKFFGKVAGTTASLALLLERREVPVIPVYCYRGSDGVVCVAFDSPVEFAGLSLKREERLYERTQILNNIIEEKIRRYPDQWLWLHRRWKPFRGASRWQIKPVLAALAATTIILSGGCVSSQVGRTGIAIPPDPKVAVPEFGESRGEGTAASAVPTSAESAVHAQRLGIVVPSGGAMGQKKDGPEQGKKARTSQKDIRAGKKTDKKAEVPVSSAAEKDKFQLKVIPPEKIPFQVGERLELELTWMALPAGKATLEVRPGPVINGRPTFHLWGNAVSSKLVDTIYHVDNTIESFVDSEGFVPYKFLLSMVETAQLKETRVVFDHVKRKAFYWSKRISKRWGNETIDRAQDFISGARDVYSALFFARLIDYSLNQTYSVTVFEKDRHIEARLTAIGNELVTTKVGVFQAWKVSVQLYLNNVLNQTGDTIMWISDDSNKYIVKFDAKIKIGSLKGTLVGLRER